MCDHKNRHKTDTYQNPRSEILQPSIAKSGNQTMFVNGLQENFAISSAGWASICLGHKL